MTLSRHYPTTEEIAAIEYRARRERSKAIHKLIADGLSGQKKLFARAEARESHAAPKLAARSEPKSARSIFWKQALESLHPSVRHRYAPHFAMAENWDRLFDLGLDAWLRGNGALRAIFQRQPRNVRTSARC